MFSYLLGLSDVSAQDWLSDGSLKVTDALQ